jgi:hypothetical protein
MLNIKETEEYIVVEFTSDYGKQSETGGTKARRAPRRGRAASSLSGKKYAVGYPKASGYTKENIEAEIARAHDRHKANARNDAATYAPLVWLVNGDSTTSRAAIDIGVIGGYVKKGSGLIYDCEVNFSNFNGLYFTFIDQSGDTYSCSTLRPGMHFIYYNSAQPSIVGVR